jgi:rare lipoprotein A (peptidoglycan hydrolase)
MRRRALLGVAVLLAAFQVQAAGTELADELAVSEPVLRYLEIAEKSRDPFLKRMLGYAKLQVSHRVAGLASYYSTFFEGRKTANGEIYRNKKYSAAHLTLPLGTWIEVRSRATGKTLRLRVNDRGPYAKKFCLDLSQAAARYLGVDKHPDRYVDFRIIALPGEEPLPEDLDIDPKVISEMAGLAN